MLARVPVKTKVMCEINKNPLFSFARFVVSKRLKFPISCAVCGCFSESAATLSHTHFAASLSYVSVSFDLHAASSGQCNAVTNAKPFSAIWPGLLRAYTYCLSVYPNERVYFRRRALIPVSLGLALAAFLLFLLFWSLSQSSSPQCVCSDDDNGDGDDDGAMRLHISQHRLMRLQEGFLSWASWLEALQKIQDASEVAGDLKAF